MTPSRTYWSVGQYDPWRVLSPLAEELQGERKLRDREYEKCKDQTRSKIDKKHPVPELLGYVIPDAQHCYDMVSWFEGAQKSLDNFDRALTAWLRCFKPD
jgi:hypothetical protein